MKKFTMYAALIFLLFCTVFIFPQEKRQYRWSGDWESIPGNCPIYCIQRKFVIERKNMPTVHGNLIRSDINHNGTQIQFITLGRSYLWVKELINVSLTGKNGYFVDDARQIPDAVSVVMDDAVKNYLQWEPANAVKKEDKKSSATSSAYNSLANSEADWERHKKETYRKLFASANDYIAKKDYDKALQNLKLASICESTPEVRAAEKRVIELIKERDKKNADEKQTKASAGEIKKEKKKAPDRKKLFAGNPGYKPYPNPYDNPDPDRPVKSKPHNWKEYPESIKDESTLKKMYDDAVRGHDGYMLLQLAEKRFYSGIKFAEVKDIMPQVYTIAKYNRDPWLMYHMGDFYQSALRRNPDNRFLPLLPGAYLKEVYDLSVLRNDPEPLYKLYLLERDYDLIPDMTEKDIIKTEYEMTH